MILHSDSTFCKGKGFWIEKRPLAKISNFHLSLYLKIWNHESKTDTQFQIYIMSLVHIGVRDHCRKIYDEAEYEQESFLVIRIGLKSQDFAPRECRPKARRKTFPFDFAFDVSCCLTIFVEWKEVKIHHVTNTQITSWPISGLCEPEEGLYVTLIGCQILILFLT